MGKGLLGALGLDDAIANMEKAKLPDADRDALRKYLYRGIGRP